MAMNIKSTGYRVAKIALTAPAAMNSTEKNRKAVPAMFSPFSLEGRLIAACSDVIVESWRSNLFQT